MGSYANIGLGIAGRLTRAGNCPRGLVLASVVPMALAQRPITEKTTTRINQQPPTHTSTTTTLTTSNGNMTFFPNSSSNGSNNASSSTTLSTTAPPTARPATTASTTAAAAAATILTTSSGQTQVNKLCEYVHSDSGIKLIVSKSSEDRKNKYYISFHVINKNQDETVFEYSPDQNQLEEINKQLEITRRLQETQDNSQSQPNSFLSSVGKAATSGASRRNLHRRMSDQDCKFQDIASNLTEAYERMAENTDYNGKLYETDFSYAEVLASFFDSLKEANTPDPIASGDGGDSTSLGTGEVVVHVAVLSYILCMGGCITSICCFVTKKAKKVQTKFVEAKEEKTKLNEEQKEKLKAKKVAYQKIRRLYESSIEHGSDSLIKYLNQPKESGTFEDALNNLSAIGNYHVQTAIKDLESQAPVPCERTPQASAENLAKNLAKLADLQLLNILSKATTDDYTQEKKNDDITTHVDTLIQFKFKQLREAWSFNQSPQGSSSSPKESIKLSKNDFSLFQEIKNLFEFKSIRSLQVEPGFYQAAGSSQEIELEESQDPSQDIDNETSNYLEELKNPNELFKLTGTKNKNVSKMNLPKLLQKINESINDLKNIINAINTDEPYTIIKAINTDEEEEAYTTDTPSYISFNQEIEDRIKMFLKNEVSLTEVEPPSLAEKESAYLTEEESAYRRSLKVTLLVNSPVIKKNPLMLMAILNTEGILAETNKDIYINIHDAIIEGNESMFEYDPNITFDFSDTIVLEPTHKICLSNTGFCIEDVQKNS